jgi:hypothetical protein
MIPPLAGGLGDKIRWKFELQFAGMHGNGKHQKRIDKQWAIS